MATTAQILANHANCQRSTGPKTPEGKAKSSRNAIRHGLLSTIIPIDAPGYRELLVGLYTSLKPQDELQRMMVDQIAVTTMRLRRIWGAEQNYLYTKSGDWPNGPDSNCATIHTYLEVPEAMTYLRYESMLNRLLARLLRQYHEIRTCDSWSEISRSESPYVQAEAAEQPPNPIQPSAFTLQPSDPPPAKERCIEPDALPEPQRKSLSTICPDIDARIAELARIPYNEFVVQSRVAAYDATHGSLGSG